jgi:DNA-directed RNA polymerase specialized sigma subunit
VSQAFATKRYQQVFGMLTAPSKGWVDNRLGSDAADYWIQALQTDMGRIKGEAKVYRLKNNEHYQQDYTERTEYIHWPNLDWHPEFQELDRRKRKLLESDEESAYVHKDDIADIKKSVRRETQRETEQQIIERMAASDLAEKHKSTTGFKQKEIGEALDVSRSRISQRLNSD